MLCSCLCWRPPWCSMCRAPACRQPACRPPQPLPVQVLNLLQHLNDSSGAIPRRELAKLIYGRDSVFSRTPSPAQIRGLARDDVVAYLSKWERPDAAVFGISGQLLLPGCRGHLPRQL